MTPAIQRLEQLGIEHAVHGYEPARASSDYGIDASAQLGVPAERVFKTLIAELDTHELVAAVVPVSHRLHMKSLARAIGAKKAFMADRARVEKTTGYVLGGVSPLGQKTALRSVIDTSAQAFDTIFVSGGRRGLEIEIGPDTLCALIEGLFTDLVR